MNGRRASIVVCLAAGVALGFLPAPRLVADASTYVLMADSLWWDHDLVYAAADLDRTRKLNEEVVQPGLELPAGLFLVKRGDSYYYGKPFLYPLVAAPFLRVFGVRGFFILNGLLLAAIVLLGAEVLAGNIGRGTALVASGVLIGFSVAPAYLHWIDPFLFLTALTAGGIAAHRRGAPALGAALLAAGAAARFTSLPLVAAPPLLSYLARRQRADVVRSTVAAAAMGGGLLLLVYGATGQWSPYTGERYWYPDPSTLPYASPPAKSAGIAMSRGTIARSWRPPSLGEFLTSNVYFLLGRSAGVLLYFPTLLGAALWTRCWDREKSVWLLAAAASCLAMQAIVPHNPAGGSHALGNRLFVMLPVAFLLVDFLAWRSWRGLATALVLVPALPLLRAPADLALNPGTVMLGLPHRLFPVEWTHAPSIPFPVRYPEHCLPPGCVMYALTANQLPWELPGLVWTILGTRAEFVFIRPRGRPPTIELFSLAPDSRVADGGVPVRWTMGSLTLTLSHPRAAFPDESHGFEDVVVYHVVVETGAGEPGTRAGGAPSRGVFVHPLS